MVDPSRAGALGFNGAAGVNPRMGVSQVADRPHHESFNGAAGVNPRMETYPPGFHGMGERRLQWGRGCEPTDGGCKLTRLHRRESASMGPRV